MLYGAVAASDLRFVPVSNARFAGVGSLIVSASLINPLLIDSANFAGAGQMNAGGFVVLSGEDPATSFWADSVISAGGSVGSTRRTVVNDFIAGLKSDSLWTKFDRLYLLAAENTQSALTDLITGTHATLMTPNPSFEIDRGYTGTGANGYINTGFYQSAGSPKATQNDTHISMWSNTSPLPTSTTGEYFGSDPSGGGTYWLYTTGDQKFTFRVNDNGAPTALASDFASHLGLFISSRSVSTERKLYQDGVLKYTTGATSQAVPNVVHGIIYSGFAHQVSAWSIGSNLNGGSDAANFYSRLATYMTAVGVL